MSFKELEYIGFN